MAVTLAGAGWYTRASFFSANQDFSLSCWAKPNTVTTSASTYRNIAGSNNAIVLGQRGDGTNARFIVGTISSDLVGSTTIVAAGTWYHLAMIVTSGGTKAIYVNGVAETLTPSSDGANTATGMVLFDFDGADNGDEFDGVLAAVKIWAGVQLTQAEIQQEMNQYLPNRTASLTGFYPLLSLSDDEIDFSGGARTLTVGGSGHTLAAGPPIAWKSGGRRMVIPTTAAAATPTDWMIQNVEFTRRGRIFVPSGMVVGKQ